MFTEQVVVISGGANGIGKCLVEKFLEKDATVWATDIDQKGLEALSQESKKLDTDLRILVLDSSKPAAIRELRDRILSEHQKIDIWINNAGIAGLGDFQKTSPEDFDRVLALNLSGAIWGTRLALEPMENRGVGVIVNVASVAGLVPAPFMTAYCASKHGVVGFTRALREELRLKDSNVRLILVSPGFVDTQILARGQALGFPEWLRWALAKPDQVAEEIVHAIEKGQEEIIPTWLGKVMVGMHKAFPNTTRRSAKLLLAKSFKDILLNRFTGA